MMRPSSPSDSHYERWIWIELIGFDNEKDDVGVGDYLDTIGFIPEAVSILISSPDIIHLHSGLDEDKAFPDDYCSYFGHRRNADREIQVWTTHKLKQLIDGFHDRGVSVFLSTFTSFLNNAFSKEFAGDHPELLQISADGDAFFSSLPPKDMERDSSCADCVAGELSQIVSDGMFDAGRLASILPLKRFEDGSFYEDFYISKLSQVMSDYNFDGWHAIDGWGPARLPLSCGDYSDDMVCQFLDWSGNEASDPSARHCDGDSVRTRERANWIMRNHWADWIAFYVDRWARFYEKTVAALHGDGRKVVLNSAWTRDPFEAIFRYGVDYARIAAAGVDGFLTESAAGAADTEAGCGGRHYSFAAALMLMSAQIPDTKLIFLHGIKDTKEQWDLLRHAPTILEKEVYSLANLYRHTGSGLKRCADGLVAMLADGIRSEEWRWLQRRWDIAFSEIPKSIVGATLVWSDAALANEIGDFIEHRGATTHRLLHLLMEKGAPIQSAVRIGDLDGVSGPILILNARLLPKAELDRVLGYGNGPIVLIGRQTSSLLKGDAQFDDPADSHGLQCVVNGLGRGFEAHIDAEEIADLPADLTGIVDPNTWLDELVMREVSDGFISACAQVISEASDAVRVVSGQDTVRTLAMQLRDGRIRLIIKNDSLFYALPILDAGRQIESIAVVTEFPCKQIIPEGSKFCIRVPGRGAVVVDLTLA